MNKEQYEGMVDRFATIGLQQIDLDKNLESMRKTFNKEQQECKVAEKKKKAEETKSNKKQKGRSVKQLFMTDADILDCLQNIKIKSCEEFDRIPQRILVDVQNPF